MKRLPMLAAFAPRLRAFLQGAVSSARPAQASPQAGPPSPGQGAPLVSEEDVLLDVAVASKHELLEEIGGHMQSAHGIEARSVALALAHRERIASTGLGEGVAIPHARVPGLQQIRSMYVRLRFPLPFEAPDGRPVTHVLVLLVPKEATQRHLEILSEAAQALGDRKVRQALCDCADAAQAVRILDAGARLCI